MSSGLLADEFRLAIAVLAAGQSRRFGDADKLTASFRGKMLGLHVCENLRTVDAAHRWVITARADHPCADGWRDAGFQSIINPDAARGMGTSVALAARRALEVDADALMICLADMPLVPVSHYAAMVRAAGDMGQDAVIGSASGQVNMPPACFGGNRFDELARSKGDAGARALLKSAQSIPCTKECLVDIDTPEALVRLER